MKNTIDNFQKLVTKKIIELNNNKLLNDIDSIMIGGSIGRNQKDSHSDIDLFLLTKSDNIDFFLTNRVKEISEYIGNISLFTGPRNVTNFGYSFTILFDTMDICQFAINSRNTLKKSPMNSAKSIFIFDKSGYYSNFLEKNSNIKVNNNNKFYASFCRFWLRLLGMNKEIKRQNYWLAIRFLFDAIEQLMITQRIVENKYPPGLNFNKPAKYIEHDLSTEFLDKLSPLIPIYNPESIKKCAIDLGVLNLQVTKKYVEENKLLFHKELDMGTKILKTIQSI